LQFGLIAEEVARILPERLKFVAEGKPLAVFYHLLKQMTVQAAQIASFQLRSAEVARQLAQ